MDKKLKGFTIIELLVVITIISVLCAIGVPAALTWVRDAKVRDANEEARLVYSAVQDYLTELEIKNIMLKSSDTSTTTEMIMYSASDSGSTLPTINSTLKNQNKSTYGGFNTGADVNTNVRDKIVDFSDALGGEFKGAWAVKFNMNTYTVITAYWMPLPNGSVTDMDTGIPDGFTSVDDQEKYLRTHGSIYGKYPM